MRSISGLMILISALIVTTPILAATVKNRVTLREQAQAVCYNDATTLCADFVPDEDKVAACMKKKRAQLSPECRAIFDQGMQ